MTSRWVVPDEYRNLAVKRIVEILEDEDASPRNHMAAASIIKSIVDTNVKIDEVSDRIERLDRGLPTEISDPGTLGVAVSGLADRLSNLIGNGPANHTRVVEVADGSETEVRGLEDRAEPSDDDAEAVEGV